jgi:hypothetical protein
MVGRSLSAAALAASLVFTSVSTGWAAPSRQDIVAAQDAFKEGSASEKQNDWAKAREAFQRSVDKNDTPDARLHLARAEAHLGHLTEANDSYKAVLDNRLAPPATKAAAKKEQQAVSERIPKLTVKVPEGFAGTVKIDSVELTSSSFGQAIEVNPGTRTVTANADGFETFTKSLVLTDRANEVIDIQMVASAKSSGGDKGAKIDTNDGSMRKTLGFVGLGVGAAGLIVGTGFGIAARSTRSELKSVCPGNVCSEAQRDTYDKGKKQATVATVGFIVGGIGLGVGAFLLLTAPSKTESSTKAGVTPFFGFGTVGLNGRF